jgi:hypothetical protein
MAREAPYAVIIRRGPARRVCTIGWDRKTDTFEVGQWLHGRIYEERADISPDGRYLIYFAGNFALHSETKGTWTAISRVPYLKAISIWAKGDTYFGGGIFLDNKTALLHGHHGKPLKLSREIRVVEEMRTWSRGGRPAGSVAPTGAERIESLKDHLSSHENTIYEASLSKRFGSYREFEKYRAGWRLNKNGEESVRNWWMGRNVTKDWWLRRPWKDAGYQLLRRGTDAIINLPPGTGWADVDRWNNSNGLPKHARVVWTNGGRLYAAEITRQGMGHDTLLYDFNPMTFEAIEAPY